MLIKCLNIFHMNDNLFSFIFSLFLFEIQILLIKISKQQVISYFLDRYWLRYGPSKRVIYKNAKKDLFENYILIFDFFSKNQPMGVKSVEEYNFTSLVFLYQLEINRYYLVNFYPYY